MSGESKKKAGGQIWSSSAGGWVSSEQTDKEGATTEWEDYDAKTEMMKVYKADIKLNDMASCINGRCRGAHHTTRSLSTCWGGKYCKSSICAEEVGRSGKTGKIVTTYEDHMKEK